MTHTAHDNLTHIAEQWPALRELLEASTPRTWPPAARMADHQRTIEDDDETTATLAAIERAERTAVAPGERPAPLRVAMLDTITELEAELVHLADEIASAVQRPAFTVRTKSASPNDHIALKIALMGLKDLQDERRWRYNMTGRDGAKAATWLANRLTGADGPFRPLTDTQRVRIGLIATSVRYRLDQALGQLDTRVTPTGRMCKCGGEFLVITPKTGDFSITCSGPCAFNASGGPLLDALSAA